MKQQFFCWECGEEWDWDKGPTCPFCGSIEIKAIYAEEDDDLAECDGKRSVT